MTNETAKSLWARLMDLRDKISQGSGKGAKIEEMIALVEIVGSMLERPALAGVDKLAPGDVVRLRSGGPAMTVLEEDENELRCGWHDATADVRMDSATFPPAALVRVEDEQRRGRRERERRAVLDRAYGALAGAEALFVQGRSDLDPERVKLEVSDTMQALLSDAAEDA